ERMRKAAIRPLDLVTGQRLRQRPVGVAVAAAARADDDRRRRLELRKRSDRGFAVAIGPQHERALDSVPPAVPARARRAADVDVRAPAEPDRPGRQTPPPARAVEHLAPGPPVPEA